MKYLLDTGTLSQLQKPVPHAPYLTWLRLQAPEMLGLSVMSLLEANFSAGLLRPRKRKTALQAWIDTGLPERFEGRILPVTAAIAGDAGHLIARNKLAGYNIGMADALIAATARVHGLSVVTLNRKHFERLEVPLVSF